MASNRLKGSVGDSQLDEEVWCGIRYGCPISKWGRVQKGAVPLPIKFQELSPLEMVQTGAFFYYFRISYGQAKHNTNVGRLKTEMREAQPTLAPPPPQCALLAAIFVQTCSTNVTKHVY